ncbi:LacI family DNA-binding transcriptional regulator [Mesomycoplasma neurolyticum]|uniref:LacI family transcriptional regulator n=1 Tax=Mesomycoplasma neurolyticum TaxID=2120 RepID=A0A449A4L2_9BACT|nr:LacI family DNA-binding transcriptional regulator [Mesomycoplasma neurolyticum]VEU59177.1 LacI family transcriptional regulator [Mesomycoplasma neurolyticum]
MVKNKKTNNNYKKIANIANVGIGTISRYFNNGYISDEKRQKIEKIITKENFSPNYRLIKDNTYKQTIYVIISSFSDSISEIINGLEKQVENEFNLLIVKATLDWRKYLSKLRYVLKQKPQNLLLFLPKTTSYLKKIISNINYVNIIVYGEIIENIKSIVLEQKQHFFNLTKNFVEKNKIKKLAYIGLDMDDPITGKERFEGVSNYIKANKIKFYSYFLEKNSVDLIEKSFEDIKRKNIKAIICGTHTIFKTIVLLKKEQSFLLTDIGGKTFFDKFAFANEKIFIDYFKIGEKIGEIFNKKIENKIFIF